MDKNPGTRGLEPRLEGIKVFQKHIGAFEPIIT